MDRDNGDNLNWDFAPPDFAGEAFDPFADAAPGTGDLGQGPVAAATSPAPTIGGTGPLRATGQQRRNDLPQFGVEDPHRHALENLRDSAAGPKGRFTPAQLDSRNEEVVSWCRERARELVRELNDHSWQARNRPAFDRPAEEVVAALIDDLLGLGPLEHLLRIPDVEDITINGPQDVWYKATGGWIRAERGFSSSEHALIVLNRAIVHTGRQAGPLTPIVDGTLLAGHRVNIVSAPLTEPWPVATIRIHRDHSFAMADLVAQGGSDRSTPEQKYLPNYFEHDRGEGMFSALAATFLHMAVIAGFNILVVGPTGVGKTTVLGALGRMIPSDRRVVVIEDVRELRMRGMKNGDNCAYFVTRPTTIDGLAAITQRDLVIAALRQRPDALTVGEARGAEVFDMLKALWTGHRNGLTSVHAHTIADVSSRIRMMLQEAAFSTEVSEATVSLWISKAFQLGITLRRAETGRRFVEEIVEFTGGVEGTVPVTTPLFRYDPAARRLKCSGQRLALTHEALLRETGFSYDDVLKAARERGELR